jgi:hypothetical protein
MSERCYTPVLARKALDFVRPAAQRVCALYRQLEQSHPRRVIPDERVEPVYFRLLRDLQSLLDGLASKGVRVRDPRRGLIDFPARRAGRPVWLCWRVGEATVQYWHEPGDGFAGRRPIDDDGPWQEAAERLEIPG